jgi:hypothetical protein
MLWILSLSVAFSPGRRKKPIKKEKYIAAVRPELASPELVEGSKGRLKLL